MKFDLRPGSAVIATAAITLLIFVASVPAMAANWRVPGQFATIQAAVDSPLVQAGDRIIVLPGDHAGAHVTKSVEIRGRGLARIVSGPLHPAGFTYGFLIGADANGAGADGVTISNLTFTVDLPVFSRGANDVTVSQNTMLNALQGVTNRGGNRWDITHNTFTDLRTACGGGIGIMLTDTQGRDVRDSVVAHNDITGTLHVAAGDCGGYQGAGILLYADFRYGFSGASSIAYNRIAKNEVSLVSDTPALVGVAAFEMTDTRDMPTPPVIYNNIVRFNDFRGTAQQIVLNPATLGSINTISRNMGESLGRSQNRERRMHPKAFQ